MKSDFQNSSPKTGKVMIKASLKGADQEILNAIADARNGTHPQEGMNTTTPPPQLLAPPVMLGESGERREEGGPSRVDCDFSPVLQQAMDDDMDDPMQFLNTAFINQEV